MCATWLANMYNRGKKPSLVDTKPHGRVAIDTHLAALRVPAARFRLSPTSGWGLRPDVSVLPIREANLRYAAAAGLKPGTVRAGYWVQMSQWLAGGDRSGGYFIDIGGHAVATFINGKTFASYENKKRLYYFDPQHGCFFSEDESSFHGKFNELVEEHNGNNPAFDYFHWSYFKVYDVSAQSDEDADMGISSLFG
jgi:hypothetical protein